MEINKKKSSAEDDVVPAWAKVKAKGQGHKHSFSSGVHELKNLYTKYEQCNSYNGDVP